MTIINDLKDTFREQQLDPLEQIYCDLLKTEDIDYLKTFKSIEVSNESLTPEEKEEIMDVLEKLDLGKECEDILLSYTEEEKCELGLKKNKALS